MKALVVDDNELVRGNVAELLRGDGWEVSEAESADRAFELLGGERWSLVFCDVKLSDTGGDEGYDVLRRFTAEQPEAQIVLMTGHASAVGALDAVSSGAYDYLPKPFENERVLGIARAVRRGIEKRARPETTGELPRPPVYTSDIELVGVSAAFVEVMKLVGRVAGTTLPVLITGESGTGKELVARAIHRRSARAARPFVAVNCGAIPSELIESELFGHVRGAFTGAERDRRGLLQEADGGTVFLDEITETTPAFQVKLLRALQEGEIRRVGSNQTVSVDVRVIAASNRDVEREMREGRFRQDLFYRLNAVTLHLPPLRERREDVMPLARHFAERAARQSPGRCANFASEAVRLLEAYDWPGNIRELENAVVRAAALCDQAIRPEDLPERVRDYRAPAGAAPAPPPADGGGAAEEILTLAELEARHVARALAHTGGNKQAAARLLGIDRTTLQRMLKRHRLDGEEKQ
ncbi:MAG TPA: sigma-54 dependent transcriptional regulator [Pyrinomonadaceae bacterium]|nr:sigma-54 dependent transcriptional regulator [Pyrinomonadaceae bacterium]